MASPVANTRSRIWPGLTIWVYPRVAIRRVLTEGARPSPLFWVAFRGFAGVLLFQPPIAVAHGEWNSGLLVAMAILGPLVGIAWMYLIGIVTARAGHWLGGSATRLETRTSWAWSSITVIPQLAIWALAVLAAFLNANSNTPGSSFMIQTFYPLAISILPIWSLAIFWLCLSEAHKFSLWRSALSLVISLVLLGVLTVVASLMFAPCAAGSTVLAFIVAASLGLGQ